MKKLGNRIYDWFHNPKYKRMRYINWPLATLIITVVALGFYNLGDWNGSRITTNKATKDFNKRLKNITSIYNQEMEKAYKKASNVQVKAVVLRDINQDNKPDVIILRNNGTREFLPCAFIGGRPVCHHPVGGDKDYQKAMNNMEKPL